MDDQAETAVNPTEQVKEVTLYWQWDTRLLIFLSLLQLGMGSAFLFSINSIVAWTGFSLFGLGAIASLTCIFVPRIHSLRLTLEGLHVKSIFGSIFIPWKNVSHFGVTWLATQAVVGFDYASSRMKYKFGSVVLSDVPGWDGALTVTYGMSAGELADILNTWKCRHELSVLHEHAEKCDMENSETQAISDTRIQRPPTESGSNSNLQSPAFD